MMKQMKWLFAAALVFMFSCANDEVVPTQQEEEKMVDFTVSVSIPQDIKTYGSGDGGLQNVYLAENHALRYIFEAWSEDGTRAHRGYKIVTSGIKNSVTFDARLMAAKYKFVFWADFVDRNTAEAEAGAADKYYNTDIDGLGLKNITIKGAYGMSNEARDAYYAAEDADLSANNYLGSVTLKRPFGKYRVIALDVEDGYKGTTPNSSQITYTAISGSQPGTVSLPGGFNALEKKVLSSPRIDVSGQLASTVGSDTGNPTIGGKQYSVTHVIGFDYIFADNAQTVAFNFECFKDGRQIGVKTEIPNIPIKANTLTTVVGDFFSNSGNISVIISNGFDNDDIVNLLPGLGALMPVQGGAYIKQVKLGTDDYHSFTLAGLPAWIEFGGIGNIPSILKFKVAANTTGLPRKATITASDNTTQEKYKLTIEQAEYIQLSSDGPKWAVSNVDQLESSGFATYPGYKGMYFQFDIKNGRRVTNPYSVAESITVNDFSSWNPDNYPTPEGWVIPNKEDYQTIQSLPHKWYEDATPAWVGSLYYASSFATGLWVGPDARSATIDNWGNAIFFPSSATMVVGGGLSPQSKMCNWETVAPDQSKLKLAPVYWTSKGNSAGTACGVGVIFQSPDGGLGINSEEAHNLVEFYKSSNFAFPVRAIKR